MTTILCPRASGVLAALGLVVSDQRRDVQRSVMLTDPQPDDVRRGACGELGRRGPRHLRPALPRPGLRAVGRGRARRAARGVRGRARARLRLPRRRRRGRARHRPRDRAPSRGRRSTPRTRAGASPPPSARRRSGRRPSCAASPRRATRSRDPPWSSCRSPPSSCRRDGGARSRPRGRCACGPGDAAGARPARCAPPARRWAPCSSRPRTRPTSRSAATARARCSTPTARW